MAQFKAIDPNVEVSAESVQSVIGGMGTFKRAAVNLTSPKAERKAQ
jgi:hypothetical protein